MAHQRADGHARINNFHEVNADNFYNQNAAPTPSMATLRGFSNVPYPAVKDFVERPKLYQQIRNELQPSSRDASAQRIAVLRGMGGAGKTQLALQYIGKHRGEFRGIFWISLVSKHSVAQEIRSFYGMMFGTGKTNVPLSQMVHQVKSWFKGQTGKWLWVLDNADNVENPADPEYIDLLQLIPQEPNVSTIITTRSTRVAQIAACKTVVIEGMEPQQALELFWKSCKIATRDVDNVKVAKELVYEFGYLALAIALAGAAISESRSMAKRMGLYQNLYALNKQELLARIPNQLTMRYSTSILVSWETSYKIIKRKSNLAANLLGFISVINPNDISPDIFERALAAGSTAYSGSLKGVRWQRPLESYEEEQLYFRDVELALGTLESYSLLKFTRPKETYVMHKLIHEWSYERLVDHERMSFGWSACAAESILAKRELDSPDEKVRLCEHVWRTFQKATRLALADDRDWFIRQWEKQSKFVLDQGQWSNAEAMQRWILKMHKFLAGPKSQKTIHAMNNLATNLAMQRRHKEAAPLMQEVVQRWTESLGPTDPNTISALNNYAGTLSIQGNATEALAVQMRVLETRKTLFGPSDASLISTRSNVALQLIELGRLDEAVEMLREATSKGMAQAGKEQNDTVSAMYNLAVALGRQNKFDTSADILRQVVEHRTCVLGPEHPDTIAALGQFGVSLGNQAKNGNRQKYREAAAVMERLFKIQKAKQGRNHPQTLKTEQNLQTIRNNLEVLTKAESASKTTNTHRNITPSTKTTAGPSRGSTANGGFNAPGRRLGSAARPS